jgi:hypothetical protein
VLADWNSEAVLDRETGLVWEKSPSTPTFTWVNAHGHCNAAVSKGNRQGWRLPTLQELASLIDLTQSNPALPSGHPFQNVQTSVSVYWTATTSADDTTFAWVVNLFTGGMGRGFAKINSGFVWCVRGGQGVDPQ